MSVKTDRVKESLRDIIIDHIDESVCKSGCPYVRKVAGMRDSIGVPITPDEYECPCNYDIGESGCFVLQEMFDINKHLEQVSDILNVISLSMRHRG